MLIKLKFLIREYILDVWLGETWNFNDNFRRVVSNYILTTHQHLCLVSVGMNYEHTHGIRSQYCAKNIAKWPFYFQNMFYICCKKPNILLFDYSDGLDFRLIQGTKWFNIFQKCQNLKRKITLNLNDKSFSFERFSWIASNLLTSSHVNDLYRTFWTSVQFYI